MSLLNDISGKIALYREHPSVMAREMFEFEPDPWQLEVLESFPHSPRLAMQACTGPGKLQPKSMFFDTPAGVRRWGDLRPGDSVFAEDGSITRIVNTYDNGIQPMFRVTFDDGSSTLAGGEHLWKVQGRTERRHFKARRSAAWTAASEFRALAQGHPITQPDGYSVLTTEQIIARGVTIPNGPWRSRQFSIPRQGPAQFPRARQALDPYLAGVWIGDGSRGNPSYCKPYLEVEAEINRRGYATGRAADGKQVNVYGSSDDFRQLGCYDCTSPDRYIPHNYKYGAVDQRRDILCGLMDTDGSIGKDGHMEFSSTSARLAQDVVWLVRSLGGVALIKDAIKEGWYYGDDGQRVECRDCYRVTVVLPFNPFRIGHKAERWSDPNRHATTQRYLTRFIASIEPEGEADSMCIEVDHPSHCYLANDFIVTHNTAVLAILGWNFLLTRPHPAIGAASVSGANLKANLWTELARFYEKSAFLKRKFDFTGSRISSRDHPDTWKMEARTWGADADATQIGNALKGLHAEYIMWLLDETGSYPIAIVPTVEAIFSGSPKEAHIVQAGNPLTRQGMLFHCCMRAGDSWKVIRITADPDDPMRTPRVSVEHARDQISQWGRDNAWVRVNILGQFPDSDINALIGEAEVRAAMKRTYNERQIGNAARILGVDVAREGDDQSVIFPRWGLQGFNMLKYRDLNSTQGAGLVSRKWIDWHADAAFIDSTGGFGAGWLDQMRTLGRSPIGIQFSQKAHNTQRFYNKRTEMYFDAIEWIKAGGALPEDEALVKQLTQTTYTFKGDRLLLEDKGQIKIKLGGRSPDEADAFVLTFAEPVSPMSTGRGHGSISTNPEAYNPYASMDKPAAGGAYNAYRDI